MSFSTAPGARSPLGHDFTKTTHHDTYAAIDPTKADLTGLQTLITGASRGIGKATAISYARAGASGIVLAARSDLSKVADDVRAAAKSAGRPEPTVVALSMDTSNRVSVDAGAQRTRETLKYVDIVINNAGALEPWLPIAESDPDTWWSTWEANVKGIYLVTRAFTPLLEASPRPLRTIVNMSSAGQNAALPGASAYQSSKLAVARLTEFTVIDGKSSGVTAFCIHPGGVMTPLAVGMPEYMHAVLVDTPELAADSLVFLTRERRDWLAGRFVSVCWDMDEFLAMQGEVEKGDLLKVRMAVGGGENRE